MTHRIEVELNDEEEKELFSILLANWMSKVMAYRSDETGKTLKECGVPQAGKLVRKLGFYLSEDI